MIARERRENDRNEIVGIVPDYVLYLRSRAQIAVQHRGKELGLDNLTGLVRSLGAKAA
jgi:hypothetical protein